MLNSSFGLSSQKHFWFEFVAACIEGRFNGRLMSMQTLTQTERQIRMSTHIWYLFKHAFRQIHAKQCTVKNIPSYHHHMKSREHLDWKIWRLLPPGFLKQRSVVWSRVQFLLKEAVQVFLRLPSVSLPLYYDHHFHYDHCRPILSSTKYIQKPFVWKMCHFYLSVM